MTPTARRRVARRFGVGIASAMTLGLLATTGAAPAAAVQTGDPIAGTGVATWGLSDYLNSPDSGRPNPKPALYGAPSTFTAGPPALSTWGEGSGTVAANGSATLSFKGTTVNWATSGGQWITLTDLEATFDNTGTGSVSALVEYGSTSGFGTEADRWANRNVVSASQRVTIVELSPDAEVGDANYPAALSNLAYTFTPSDESYTWSGLIGRWSSDFLTHLRGNYSGGDPIPQGCVLVSTCWGQAHTVVNNVVNGVVRYPAEFRFAIDRASVEVTASADVSANGIEISIDGTSFKKTDPGVDVSLRTRSAGDSDYAGGSLPVGTPTSSVSAAAIGDSGSFTTSVQVTKAQVLAMDTAGTYTIVTRKADNQGMDPAHADQISETPIDLAAVLADAKSQLSTVVTASADVSADGIEISVDGTKFEKPDPGVDVSLRTRSAGDSDYAGESLPVGTPTSSVSAAAMGDDGSFTTSVQVTKAQVLAMDTAGTYTIVTRKADDLGTDPAHAHQISETPIDLAAVLADARTRLSTVVTATAAEVTFPAVSKAKITVKTAGGAPVTGSVTVKDGDTVVGTSVLTDGLAKVSIPSTVAGTKEYAVEYGGDTGFWASSGTVSVKVKKEASTLSVTGPSKVAYATAATYTATVSRGTGSVTVYGAGSPITASIVGGSASLTIPNTLAAGVRPLLFAYGGDATTKAAPSVSKTVTISRGLVTIATTLTSEWTAAAGGTLEVRVLRQNGPRVPTGEVGLTLIKGATTIAKPAKSLSDGVVQFKLPKGVVPGTWSATVKYKGSTQHKPASHSVALTVS